MLTKSYILTFAKEMGDYDVTLRQLRALITSYCLLNNIEVDEAKWDNFIADIYYALNNEVKLYNKNAKTYDKFDMFMCEDLV